MPESLELHKEIIMMKKDIEDIKITQELKIRQDRDKYIEYVDKVIGRSKERALVFLAVNGTRRLKEIAERTNLKPQNVSRSKKILEKSGLIYKLPDSGIYAKPRWVQILHIDEYIRKKFDIPEGVP
ncbi:hypothetical protein DRN52_06365 [Thermococci archaeon]|nr:MAG: hypothetical protein DRN52_06365 [Thermococci archaeon]